MAKNNKITMSNKKSAMGAAEKSPKLGVFQIAEGMTSEQMMPVFFNSKALREPALRLYQLNTRGLRYYYYFDKDGAPVFLPSVTTVLRKTMPENVFLTDWKLSLGKDKADAYTAERAAYGTFLHGQIERLVVNRTYDLDGLKDELAKYIDREALPTGFINYAEELKRDLLAFAQFMWDYDIKPYAVEIALTSQWGFAGMIDLVADIRKWPRTEEGKAIEKAAGDEKKLSKIAEKAKERVDAIIDFKSGKKGFYEEYEIQLGMYKLMWDEWFPDIEVQALYNWSPKDWRKAPTYNFKEQTDSPSLAKIPHLLDLYALIDSDKKDVTIVGGSINLDSPAPTEGCVKVVTLAELVKEKEERPESDEPLFEEGE